MTLQSTLTFWQYQQNAWRISNKDINRYFTLTLLPLFFRSCSCSSISTVPHCRRPRPFQFSNDGRDLEELRRMEGRLCDYLSRKWIFINFSRTLSFEKFCFFVYRLLRRETSAIKFWERFRIQSKTEITGSLYTSANQSPILFAPNRICTWILLYSHLTVELITLLVRWVYVRWQIITNVPAKKLLLSRHFWCLGYVLDTIFIVAGREKH